MEGRVEFRDVTFGYPTSTLPVLERHAYSYTVGLSSGAQAYLNLEDPKYLQALENAWRFMEPQRYASGGWGPEEQFVHLGAHLDPHLARDEPVLVDPTSGPARDDRPAASPSFRSDRVRPRRARG